MNMWDDLPNAQHIDWVIQSVRQYPDQWDQARYAVQGRGMGTFRRLAYDAAWSAGHVAGRNQIQRSAYEAVCWRENCYPEVTLRNRMKSSAGAWAAAGGATLALISYDDCAHLLDTPSENLLTWAMLSDQSAAVLLLPAVIASELILKLETV
jgi:hypothetical protein